MSCHEVCVCVCHEVCVCVCHFILQVRCCPACVLLYSAPLAHAPNRAGARREQAKHLNRLPGSGPRIHLQVGTFRQHCIPSVTSVCRPTILPPKTICECAAIYSEQQQTGEHRLLALCQSCVISSHSWDLTPDHTLMIIVTIYSLYDS